MTKFKTIVNVKSRSDGLVDVWLSGTRNVYRKGYEPFLMDKEQLPLFVDDLRDQAAELAHNSVDPITLKPTGSVFEVEVNLEPLFGTRFMSEMASLGLGVANA